MLNRATSDLAGIPDDTLRQWLADAQNALHLLRLGGQAVTVKYVQGDGEKSVTYKAADFGTLSAYIAQLKAQLGITCGRRAIRPYF